jgi:hypothetical protein
VLPPASLVRFGYPGRMLRTLVWLLFVAGLTGCAGEETSHGGTAGAGTTGAGAGGGGSGPEGCAPGEADDPGAPGTCRPAGVHECADGFVLDGDAGCRAELPARACDFGTMALPGETRCRAVAECGRPPWGDIRPAADTQFVDAAYGGADSNGTAAKPWTTIQQAVDAATTGALIAVAEGMYPEAVVVGGKAVAIEGRCPALVEIAGPEAVPAVPAVLIGPGADGTSVRRIAVSGADRGIQVDGATDVNVEAVWIHDTHKSGMVVLDDLGDSGARLAASLVERTERTAVSAFGSQLQVTDSVLRDVLPRQPDLILGYGVFAQIGDVSGAPAIVSLSRSIVERCHEEGVRATGAEVTLDGVLVRDVSPSAADDLYGRGVNAFVLGGVIPRVTVRRSVIEQTFEAGINVAGGDLLVEHSVVRDTRAQKAEGLTGYGVAVHPDAESDQTSGAVELRWSLVENTEGVGLLVTAPAATLEGLVVRGGTPGPYGDGGRGIDVQRDRDQPRFESTATVRGIVLSDNAELGLVVIDASAAVSAVKVTGTLANALGIFGDGVAVVSQYAPASASLERLLVEDNVRAGVTSFGATIAMKHTTLECNPIDLDGEELGGSPFVLNDEGGNRCGCDGVERTCKVASSSLSPPGPVDDPL